MGYRKGTIVISEESDIPLLRHVRNSRFVSCGQLFHLLEHELGSLNLKAQANRLNRLVRGDYIRSLSGHKHRGSQIYSIAPLGLLELESHGDFCFSLNSETRHMPHPLQVHHCVELTDIRLALIRSSMLVAWKTEVEIASENLFYGRFQKNYDALVTIYIGHENHVFALEYERKDKGRRMYETIRSKLEGEHDIPCVLYIASSSRLARLLALHLTPATKPLAVTSAHSFRQHLLGAEVRSNLADQVVPLTAFLASASTRLSPPTSGLERAPSMEDPETLEANAEEHVAPAK